MMNVSKKKKNEFDMIFKLFNTNNFYIDVKLFENLFVSDFYETFLLHTDNKINDLLKNTNNIILHVDINQLSLKGTYHYDKIIQFCKILHKYTLQIINIMIYGNSTLFKNIICLINLTFGIDVNNKIIFNDDLKFKQIKDELQIQDDMILKNI